MLGSQSRFSPEEHRGITVPSIDPVITCLKGFLTGKPVSSSHLNALEKSSSARESRDKKMLYFSFVIPWCSQAW